MTRFAVLFAVIATSLPAVADADYLSTVLADNPVGFWQLNDASGSTTAINSGAGGAALDGTYTPAGKVDGTGLPSGVSAGALFNNPGGGNVNGNHVAGTGIASAFSGSWTIEGWFVRNSATPAGTIFSNNGTSGDKSGPVLTFGDPAGGTDVNSLYLMNSSVAWNTAIGVSLGSGSIGKAVYTVLSYNATTNQASLYAHVDDSGWVSNTNQTVPWTFAVNDAFDIGQHCVVNYPFDGTIADVAVYSNALAQADVLAHFNAAVPEPSTVILLVSGALGLQAYAWRKRK